MNKNTILKVLLIFAIVLCIFGIAQYINKLQLQENELNEKIEKLTLENQELLLELEEVKESSYKSEFYKNSIEENYNYLALGNSITWHRTCDYWCDEFGMAASSIENDYYHLVLKELKNKHDKVNSQVYNFISWETLSTDRAETLELIDIYLNNKLDLVTIQLGENVSETTTFESDFLYLIQYIQEKAPKAKVVVVGNFWKNDTVEQSKINVAKKLNIKYVDLSEIQERFEYQNKVGDIVYNTKGEEFIIDNPDVARHPNDKAMRYIAEKILELI